MEYGVMIREWDGDDAAFELAADPSPDSEA